MSTKGGPVFTFSFPAGAPSPLAPPSVTPLPTTNCVESLATNRNLTNSCKYVDKWNKH